MTNETMPQLFGRLEELTSQIDHTKLGDMPDTFELHSDRELTATDRAERVTVTMADFKVKRIRVDHLWYADAELDDVENHITEAVNKALGKYLEQELAEASDAAVGIDGYNQKLREISADFHAAFTRQMDDLSERMRRA